MATKKLVIIGSGPAGLTAAIYASRAGLSPLVIEGRESGGQLTTTTEVENFPGFPDGIMGPELMEKMKSQAARFGTEYLASFVTDIDLSKRPFKLTCDNGQSFLAETVIISTGASAKYLNIPHEKELIGKGVSACATCDGFFYRGRKVFVVGGGDTAMEEASFLTKFATSVTVIHRRDTLRASKPMQDRAFANPKISFIWDSTVSELKHNAQGLNGIVIENLKTGEKTHHEADGIFMAIGHTPNTQFLKGQLEVDSLGFLKTHNHVNTKIEGVYACGDVQDHEFRQGITSAGSGCMAAMRAERFLQGH